MNTNDNAIYEGFSTRLNHLLDISDFVGISSVDERVALISKTFGVNDTESNNWVAKDIPPKETTLFEIAGFLLNHIASEKEILPARVVSWLRYGEVVSPCPFQVDDFQFPEPIDIEAAFTNGPPEGYIWEFSSEVTTWLQMDNTKGVVRWYLTKEQGDDSDDPEYYLEVPSSPQGILNVIAQVADKSWTDKGQLLEAIMPAIRAVSKA